MGHPVSIVYLFIYPLSIHTGGEGYRRYRDGSLRERRRDCGELRQAAGPGHHRARGPRHVQTRGGRGRGGVLDCSRYSR